LSGKVSYKEKEVFYKMLESSPEDKRNFLLQKNIYSLLKAEQFSTSQQHKEKSFEKLWSNIVDNKKRKSYAHQLLKYAAVILLMLTTGIGTYYISTSTNDSNAYVYESQNASISSILLSDGSKIWLNANSKITITESKKVVNTKLTGEAYFEITHNEKRDFFVDLGSIVVKDLGTEFNVSAYPEDEYYTATLTNGDIDILDAEYNLLSNIDPGEKAIFNRTTGKVKIEKTDVSIYSAWKENKFVFIDKNLSEICEDLENWYGIHFTIEDSEHANVKYTCIIQRSTTIKQVMDMLEIVSGIEYKIEKDKEGEEIVIIQ